MSNKVILMGFLFKSSDRVCSQLNIDMELFLCKWCWGITCSQINNSPSLPCMSAVFIHGCFAWSEVFILYKLNKKIQHVKNKILF